MSETTKNAADAADASDRKKDLDACLVVPEKMKLVDKLSGEFLHMSFSAEGDKLAAGEGPGSSRVKRKASRNVSDLMNQTMEHAEVWGTVCIE